MQAATGLARCLRHTTMVASSVIAMLMSAMLGACSDATTGEASSNASDGERSAVGLGLLWTVTKANNGLMFRSPPEVVLLARGGAPIARTGTLVRAEIASGSGRLIGNTVAVTRANGHAVFTDLGVQGIGPFVLGFTVTGLPAVSSRTVAVTEPPVGLTVASQPTFVARGGALATLVVTPRDVYGDNTGEDGIVITASLASGSGTLSGTTSVATDGNGAARFAAMSIAGFGPHVLRFSAPGLPAATSLVLNVEQRPASLTMEVQPAGVTSGLAIRTQPRVRLRDAEGAAVSQRGVPVSVSLASGTGSLYGTTTVQTNEQGIGVFTDLFIAGSGAHILRFSSEGLTSTASHVLELPPFALAFGLDQFALVRAGSFDMGSNIGFGNERPVHQVTISRDFYLQKTEITQAQFGAVMGRNPSVFISCGGECPVENITLNDVDEFLRRLNEANPGVTFRLPTEAEWEYAARAGRGGDDLTLADVQGWHSGNSGGRTQPVARRQPNTWGLYDMLGNVWEWVSDWYDDYPSLAVTDPVGPREGTLKVYRGGAWNVPASLTRIPVRRFADPEDTQAARGAWLGLRLVRTP